MLDPILKKVKGVLGGLCVYNILVKQDYEAFTLGLLNPLLLVQGKSFCLCISFEESLSCGASKHIDLFQAISARYKCTDFTFGASQHVIQSLLFLPLLLSILFLIFYLQNFTRPIDSRLGFKIVGLGIRVSRITIILTSQILCS